MAKTNWQMDDTVMPDDLNQIGQEINELKADGSVTTSRLANNSVTDEKIGDRTISDTIAPTTNTAKPTSLLNGLAHMVKAITGKSNWRSAPATTLEAAKTHMDDSVKHITAAERAAWNGKETPAGAQTKADTAQAAAVSAAATDATSKVNAHAADGVAHITAAERTTWNAKASTSVATTNTSGLMSATDKNKLDGIAAGANNYTHPATHPPSMIAQDANNRFVTDSEKAAWNGKASTNVATTSASGLMSASDKSKLDGVAAGANHYVHPSGDGNQHVPATGTTNNAKVLKAGATAGSAAWGNVSFSEVTGKPTTLAGYGITDAAPSSHIGIGGTAHAAATTSAAGFMSTSDKSKLDGIAAGANNYTHPAAHPPSIITQDASNRFVTDAEKSAWNAKASAAIATTSANGLMSAADKTKLNGVATGAQVNRSIATQAQAIAGTDNTTAMTPLRVREAIDARTRYGTTAGSATALTLTLSPALASLYTGLQVTVKLHTNTGTNPTLNVNSLGAKALYDGDGARFSGESGKIYSFVFDGTNFILRSGGGGGKLNVYTGTTQPTKKEGVWIQTSANLSGVVNDLDIWMPNAWSLTNYADMPYSDSPSGLFAVSQGVYVYVGGAHLSNLFYRYNTLTDTWTELSEQPSKMSYGSAVIVGNDIYVANGSNGGGGSSPIHQFYKYNIPTNTWTQLSSVGVSTVSASLVHVSGKLYYMGGASTVGGTISNRTVRIYDISNDSWSNGSQMPSNRSGHSAVSIGTNIYVMGGTSATLNIYDTLNNSWSQAAYGVPGSKSDGGAVVAANKIYYLGGSTVDVFSYDINTSAWTTLEASSVLQRSSPGVALVNNMIYVIGGYGGSGAIGYQGVRAFSLTSKSFNAGTAILYRSNPIYGAYHTELVSLSNPLGNINSRLLTCFDDIYFHDGSKLRGDLPSYYGNGSAWVKFKN